MLRTLKTKNEKPLKLKDQTQATSYSEADGRAESRLPACPSAPADSNLLLGADPRMTLCVHTVSLSEFRDVGRRTPEAASSSPTTLRDGVVLAEDTLRTVSFVHGDWTQGSTQPQGHLHRTSLEAALPPATEAPRPPPGTPQRGREAKSPCLLAAS